MSREKLLEDDERGRLVPMLPTLARPNAHLTHPIVGLAARQPLTDRMDGDGDVGAKPLNEPQDALGRLAGRPIAPQRKSDHDGLDLELADDVRDTLDSRSIDEALERRNRSPRNAKGVGNGDAYPPRSKIDGECSH